ncbi:radical SAM protein [Lactococcus lactis]|uniref:Radical SAM protein n=1 Tax=Lactococcus lactis TaxID=1358 RepID=A0A9X4S495_9LACT|nr:radical SAM protein [Lactococcus lactis]MDG4983780.1 radical SAM protein [Lactococcus lactis]
MNQGEEGTLFYNLITKRKKVLNISKEVIGSIENHEKINTTNEELELLDKLCHDGFAFWSGQRVHVEPIKTNKYIYMESDRIQITKLSRLSISLTDRCDLNCKFCKLDYSVYSSCTCQRYPNSFHEKKLEFNQWKNIIDQAVALGINECIIMGGNPLLEKKTLEQIVKYLSEISIRVVIITNGVLLNNEFIDYFKDKNVSFRIELMSYTGRDFSKLYDTFMYLKKVKLNTTIDLIVSSLNEHIVEEVENQLKNSGFFTNRIYIYPSNEFYSKKFFKHMLNPDNRTFPVNVYNFPYISNYNNCLYGQLFVNPYGTLYPCPKFRKEPLGNVLKDSLSKIYSQKNHEKFWNIPKSKVDSCNSCELSPICFDCRALDSYKTNNLMGMEYCEKIYKKGGGV